MVFIDKFYILQVFKHTVDVLVFLGSVCERIAEKEKRMREGDKQIGILALISGECGCSSQWCQKKHAPVLMVQ